jgi:hypothetical protein
MKKIKRGLINVLLLLLAACMTFTGCKPAPAPDNGDTTLNNGGEGNGGENDGNQTNETDDGNKEEKQGLEIGAISGGSRPSSDNYCGCKSEKNEFDIDDVTLEFYFGYPFTLNGPRSDVYEDWFYIYFTNETEGIEIVKKVEESFFSEKYNVEIIVDYENLKITGVEYAHSEMLTIPKELFVNDSGTIWFRIIVEHKNAPETDRLRPYRVLHLHYKVDGDKVILK